MEERISPLLFKKLVKKITYKERLWNHREERLVRDFPTEEI